MKSEILKIVVLFMVLSILLGGLSYSTELPAAISHEDEEYYYLTFHTRDEWQIWKIALDGSSEKILYQVPYEGWMDQSSAKEQFNTEFYEQMKEGVKEESFNWHYVSSVKSKISPDSNFIAIDETLLLYSEKGLDGQSTIFIYDVRSAKEVFRFTVRAKIDHFQWSNDMKYFSYEEMPFGTDYEANIIHIYDIINEQEIYSVNGYSGIFIDGATKFISKFDPGNEKGLLDPGNCCQYLDFETGELEFKPFSDNVAYLPVYDLKLSNDGKRMAVIGFSSYKMADEWEHIKIINSKNDRIEYDFPIFHEIIANPDMQWSYDDRYLVYKVGDIYNLEANITDLFFGRNILVGPRVYDYAWSRNSNRLLYLSGDETVDPCIQETMKALIFDVEKNSRSELSIPDSLNDYMEKNSGTGNCITFITEVDW